MKKSCAVWVLLLVLMSCKNKKEDIPFESWDKTIRNVGTFSSPRTSDLTGDGIKDIVIGAGKVEMQATDSAVFALDGATGEILWNVGARDQLFGSARFQDITGDDVPDVFIGGRSAEFMAIDGKNGEIIWEYFPQGDDVDFTTYKIYNFYTPQFIADVDADGYPDILIANGGYVRALPTDPNRPPGKLMVISAATGQLIAEAYMPDGKETYMSCIVMDESDVDPRVLFGSGGERIPGNLYVTRLSGVLKGDLSDAQVIASGGDKGFIAPPVLADINSDGQADIIANSVNGRMLAIDGHSYKKLWEVTLSGTEAYCSLAVGYFDEDDIPDFFTNFGIGQFPDLMRSYQMAVSGADGQMLKMDSLGSFHYGSPVAYDIDQDGFDEVFYHINESNPQVVRNVLMVFDIHRDSVYKFTKHWLGANVASTPLLDDLNADGLLDIVYVHENNPVDLFSHDYKTGLAIHMEKTRFLIEEPVRWGAYMSSLFNGQYNPE